MPRPWVRQSLHRRVPLLPWLHLFIALQFCFQPIPFLASQKLCFTRPRGQYEVGENSEIDGRDALKNEQPPPASQVQPMHVSQTEAGNLSAQNAPHREPRQK